MSAHYNFRSVVEEFFELRPFKGPHAETLRQMVRARASEILAHPDIRYMPAFKILDLLAEMVNTASAVALEPQLRAVEARALVRETLTDQSPLVRQFMLEAALERARYEPMMIESHGIDALTYRNLTLRKRWAAMMHAHQALATLPEAWMLAVNDAVERAILSDIFQSYRTGPLLQFFAEMLQAARQLHAASAPIETLQSSLAPESGLWKRYALKAARYQEKNPEEAQALPAHARIPGLPYATPRSVH